VRFSQYALTTHNTLVTTRFSQYAFHSMCASHPSSQVSCTSGSTCCGALKTQRHALQATLKSVGPPHVAGARTAEPGAAAGPASTAACSFASSARAPTAGSASTSLRCAIGRWVGGWAAIKGATCLATSEVLPVPHNNLGFQMDCGIRLARARLLDARLTSPDPCLAVQLNSKKKWNF